MKKFVWLFVLIMSWPAFVFGQGLPLKDGTTSSLADIEACGAFFCLIVKTPSTPADTGVVGIVGTTGDPASNATVGRANRVYATEGNELAVTQGNLLWDDTFNALAQNTGKYRFGSTTQTAAQAGGFLIFNNSLITTINTNSAVQTFKVFPLFGKSELRANFSAVKTVVPQANETYEIGLFNVVSMTSGGIPTDGVFFRWSALAELRGVTIFNGITTQSPVITSPSIDVNHDYLIVIQTNTVNFYIDNVLSATITLLTDAPTNGQPMMSATAPLTMRYQIGGGAPPAVASQIRISDVFVKQLGVDLQRSWEAQKAGFGHMAYQGQNGGTMGTTAQYANNVNPATAVPTNTTAALGTGLGGIFQETLTLAAGTDGIISSFQNPTGTVNQTARNLIINGVCVGGVVTVALSTNPLAGTMALNFGHTAVSLATAETGSFVSGTTKAPRRIGLYATTLATVTSPAGTAVNLKPEGCIKLSAPVVVAPSEFVAISHKKVTVAPATGSIMWAITFDAYFE